MGLKRKKRENFNNNSNSRIVEQHNVREQDLVRTLSLVPHNPSYPRSMKKIMTKTIKTSITIMISMIIFSKKRFPQNS